MPTFDTSTLTVVIFLRSSGRTLFLLLRPAASEGSRPWQLPSGAVGDDESCPHAALRLVGELTGQPTTGLWAPDYLHTAYAVRDDRISVSPVFVAEVSEPKILRNPRYVEERWITCLQAKDLLRSPGQRSALLHANDEVVTSLDRGTPFRVPIL